MTLRGLGSVNKGRTLESFRSVALSPFASFMTSKPAATPGNKNTSGPTEPRKRPFWASLWFYLVTLFILVPTCLILWLAIAGHPDRQFTIAPETTVVTEPVMPNGLVDYGEAMRRNHRAEVDPNENCVRLLVEALGPSLFNSPEAAGWAYEELDMTPLPAAGDYRVTLGEAVRQFDADAGVTRDPSQLDYLLNEPLSHCQQTPWTDGFPEFDAWIAVNAVPLERVQEASRLPCYRHPVLLPPGASLFECLLPIAQEIRDFGRLLTVRAMRRLGNGDAVGAWEDIHALHRLARLQSQGDTLIEYLVGSANAAVATNAMSALLSSEAMTPELLETIRDDWQQLPEWADISKSIDVTERCGTLDVVQRAARFGPAYLSQMMGYVGYTGGSGGFRGYPAHPLMTRCINAMVDWDEVMVSTNDWYDQLTIAMTEADPATREMLIEQFDRDVEALAADTRDAWFPSTHNIGGKILSSMLPAISNMHQALCARDTRMSLVDTALAIEQFRFDQGRIPATLSELVPEYMPAVPLDPHASTEELRYLLQGDDGYVLYSTGRNAFDDGGLTQDADTSFRVRMPVPDWLELEPTPTSTTPTNPEPANALQ